MTRKTLLQQFLLLAFFAISFIAKSQSTTNSNATDTVVSRFIVVGDAGEFKHGEHPVLKDIRLKAMAAQKKATAIFFLGDNVYPIGLPDPASAKFDDARKVLDSQWTVGSFAADQVLFIPGNHDWAKGRAYGWKQVLQQGEYINGLGKKEIRFLPEDGCPGPEEIQLNDRVTVVLMDSQWWLQQDGRPGASSDCECKTNDEVIIRLKDIVYRNRHKMLLFLSHHPFYSDGIHGGYFTIKQHIFPLLEFSPLAIPLPLIGSIYPIVRGGFGNIQDLKHPVYKSFIQGIDTILKQHPYCIRLSGHEHGLQYLVKDSQQYLISGAGSKKTRLRKGAYSKFNAVETGYAVIDLYASGKVNLRFEGVEENSDSLLYATALPHFSPAETLAESVTEPVFPDSISVVTAPYYKAGSFKKWFLGKNYRQEWTTPVTLPVINIRNVAGGLKPTQRGGGMQSRSLRLEDSSGKEYVLRSIEKYPDKILPEQLQQTFVKDIVVDGISASYPFAAVSIPKLAVAAGIPYLTNRLVYVPDDPALEQYRHDFAKGIYLFEEREPEGVEKTYNTTKVGESLLKDNDNEVNQKAVLQARLLDLFIMDFDRHEDQWRWMAKETKDGKKYSPIPRDRDQAFFINNGLLPGVISRSWLQPKFQGFKAKARDINRFNFNARYFDRLFLTEPDAADWQKAISKFLPTMTDSVIDAAMAAQPAAIREGNALQIASTLKERRRFLEQDAMKYYRFLSKAIDVTGSNKREFFDLNYTDSGFVQLQVFKINKEGRISDKKYERLIDPSITKEIRLYGMGGDDVFKVSGNKLTGIRTRIIGGAGKDSLLAEQQRTHSGKLIWYDQSTEKNVAVGEGTYRKRFSSNPAINQFDPHAFRYNITAPVISVAYNPDDGVFLGAGVRSTRQGFRKSPFAVRQLFTGNYAMATGAFNFRYQLEAIGILPLSPAKNKRIDLLFNANLKAPDNIQNYFGLGNETEFPNKGSQKIAYYRSRFNLVEAIALLRAKIAGPLSFLTGPVVQRYWIDPDDNDDRFISSPDSDQDQESLYKQKSYFGWQAQLVVDDRNNQMMPSRGIYWNSYARWVTGLNTAAHAFQQYRSDLSFYTSFNARANFVVAVRVGAGSNGGGYEFFQAQYLSGPDNLRGFRKYRFAGERMFYNNIDLRIKLGEIKGYILPATAGLLLFHDIGRVWLPDEKSGRWHNGYGAGIWLAPAGMYVITANYALSKDGGLPSLSLGFQF